MSNLLRQLSDNLSSLRTSAADSVVMVQNSGGRGGAGAGTIWHSDGLVITNAHVVRGVMLISGV